MVVATIVAFGTVGRPIGRVPVAAEPVVGAGPRTPKRQLTDKVVSTWRLEPGKTYDVTFP